MFVTEWSFIYTQLFINSDFSGNIHLEQKKKNFIRSELNTTTTSEIWRRQANHISSADSHYATRI